MSESCVLASFDSNNCKLYAEVSLSNLIKANLSIYIKNKCKQDSCKNGATCVSGLFNVTCLCRPLFKGNDCSTYFHSTRLANHTERINYLTILPNGNLASASYDNSINIWNTVSFELVKKLTLTSYLTSLLVVSDEILAIGTVSGNIIFYNLQEMTHNMTINAHNASIESFIKLDDGDFVSGSRDNLIKIWNKNDLSKLYDLTEHTGDVRALAVLKNGNFVSGSRDKKVKIWKKGDTNSTQTLNGFQGWIHSLVVLHNGDLVSSSSDLYLKVWDTSTWLLKQSIKSSSFIHKLLVLPNGNLAGGSDEKSVVIWSSNDWNKTVELFNHTTYVETLEISQTGDLVSADDHGGLIVWNKDLCIID